MAAEPQHDPPQGMEKYDLAGPEDLGALSPDQQSRLNDFKITTRVENEKYLRCHPEVESLVSGFLSDVLKERPEDIREFAAVYFTDPKLNDDLEKQLDERQERMKENNILQKV